MFRQRESNAVQQVAPEAKGSFHFQQIVPPEIPFLSLPFLSFSPSDRDHDRARARVATKPALKLPGDLAPFLASCFSSLFCAFTPCVCNLHCIFIGATKAAYVRTYVRT